MDDIELVRMALKAREFSYSPYSNFQVGAALLDDEGNVIGGNKASSDWEKKWAGIA